MFYLPTSNDHFSPTFLALHSTFQCETYPERRYSRVRALEESRTTVGGPANETRISFARTDRTSGENPEESFRENTVVLLDITRWNLSTIYVIPRAQSRIRNPNGSHESSQICRRATAGVWCMSGRHDTWIAVWTTFSTVNDTEEVRGADLPGAAPTKTFRGEIRWVR